MTRPEIYFGEATNDYCFVNTHLKEFDYPAGDQNVYTSYCGRGRHSRLRASGGGCSSRWTSARRTSCFSSDISPESRLMIYRHVLERAERLTPFLRYDHDPYMVVADDGALVLDARRLHHLRTLSLL